MPTVLDNQKAISRIDSRDMLGAVEKLPEFIQIQLDDEGRKLEEIRSKDFHDVVLMGMGGSASAADVTLDWLSNKISIPAIVHRDPGIPRFVGADTLLIALSYSGETRETLAAFREARKRGSSLIGIGTGGKLREHSKELGIPFVDVLSAPAPRAALGQMIVACANALHGCGIIQNPTAEIELVVKELRRLNYRVGSETPLSDNPAKRLASSLKDRMPVVFAFRRIASVARRFKNQLAENSKMTAKYSLLPEAAHNEIEGWHNPHLPFAPMFVRDPFESLFEKSMLHSFQSTIGKASGIRSEQVRLNSKTRLGSLLSPILYLDYVSVYLALLRGLDPTDTPWIRRYKSGL